MKIINIILVLAVIAFSFPVDSISQSDKIIAFTGRVKHYSYEGGFFGIVDGEGRIFKPVELLPSFRIENLSVKVKARLVKGTVLTNPWGIPIEIIKIERYQRR
jgi:hypothetical protein